MYKNSSRISINVPNEFHYSLKRRALDNGITIKKLVTECLIHYLNQYDFEILPDTEISFSSKNKGN